MANPYLMAIIEKKRMQMFELAQKYGYSSAKTVECSQQLDELLNLLDKVQKLK
jgi:hypothetical protein